MKKLFLLIPIIFLVGAILFPGGTARADCPPAAICIPNPLKATSIQEIIESIINFIFYLSLAVVPLMAIIGAFYFLTSTGDSTKINKARDIFLYTAVGFAIILMSKGLIAILKQVLG